MTDLLEERVEKPEDAMFTSCWEMTGCPPSNYLACAAFQQRKNCYELDRVVCCAKHRDNCASCHVYIAINTVPVRRMVVHLCTERFDIVGAVHLPAGMRLSDFINREDRTFIVITDAKLTAVGDPERVIEDSFAVVNKAHIIVARPLDESES